MVFATTRRGSLNVVTGNGSPVGLESGSQAPPGLYIGNLVYVYPTDTIKGNNGRDVTLPESLTSVAEIILINVVTN
jgi:hypothetical protein